MTLAHDSLVLTIPAYNEARHIRETIESVKAQTWTDFVAVISDNASTDETEEVCRSAIAGDPRFHYVRQPRNLGASGNFMWLLDNTRSPLFMWLGAHDLITPDYLASHVPAMLADRSYSLSYSLTGQLDEAGRQTGISDPSNLADITGRPLRRFFVAARAVSDCTAINNVLRREAIGSVRLVDATGPDKAMLSALLYWGPARRVDRPQYLRRAANSVADYMERLTGRKGLSFEYSQIIDLQLETFGQLVGWSPARLTKPLLRSMLERRYGRHFRASDWIHNRARELLRL